MSSSSLPYKGSKPKQSNYPRNDGKRLFRPLKQIVQNSRQFSSPRNTIIYGLEASKQRSDDNNIKGTLDKENCHGQHEVEITALYKGVVPTMLRQGCNQAVNFTTYNIFKKKVLEAQNKNDLDHWQSLILGGVSGGFGPIVNNPLDVVKTRMQRQVIRPDRPAKYTGIVQAIGVIYREEGFLALWKGITPRLLRIVPGQAITFMTYEAVSSALIRRGYFAS